MSKPNELISAQNRHQHGYSLIELIMVVAIVVTLGSIGVPIYIKAIDSAKNVKAMGDIKYIRTEIQAYQARNQTLPASLEEFGSEIVTDPWGRPYIIGAESMKDEDQKRILAIAGMYSWTGYTGKREPALTADEIFNLSIAKGTLTPKERRIVNSHIETSIRMLNSLHYPKSLRNVPVHAGAHHERVDGKGYPMGLAGEEITLQGKIIAIADTFEALTASNRPYQRPRKLSEVMGMLHEMK